MCARARACFLPVVLGRQALEDEFERFVESTERRVAAPLAVTSVNSHLSAHTDALRQRREEAQRKEEEAEQRAVDAARQRRVQLTASLQFT